MTDPDDLSRRDFLGFLGLALLGPTAAPMAGGGREARAGSGPTYLGSMRRLLESVPLGPGWEISYYALVESLDAPPSEWEIDEISALGFLVNWSLDELPVLFRTHGVLRACEADVSTPPGAEPSTTYLADVTAFEDIPRCEAAWQGLMAKAAEAGLDPYPGLGDAAVVASPGSRWSLPGKLFFRRGNVLASVFAFTGDPESNAHRFGAALDGRIIALSR